MGTRVPLTSKGESFVAAIDSFRKTIHGNLFQPGEPGYEDARRIWNAMIDKRPAIIVRPSGVADITACVNFARDYGIPLSIRGGGHNVAGTALNEGGLMIDMSQRRAIRVDSVGRTVRVEAGATWADIDHETQHFGLVVPCGINSTTGVAGFTLGAGFGWTSRLLGFAADNLISTDIVTADGVLRHASETENADLFWGLRGGGGNFGVVTSFKFRAHLHGPDALCGMVVHPMERAAEVIDLYREVTSQAPDALCCLLILRIAPPAPFLPVSVHDTPIAAIAAHWTGDPSDGAIAMRPLKAFAQPLADTIAVKPFVAHQTMFDSGVPFGRRYYWKSDSFDEVGRELGIALVGGAKAITSPYSAILLMHLAGVPTRTASEATAVGIRNAQYVLNVQGAWEKAEEDHRHIAWARSTLAAAQPYSTGSNYINFLTADEGDQRIRSAYGALYERLRDVKTKYDPTNLFRGNQNILPR